MSYSPSPSPHIHNVLGDFCKNGIFMVRSCSSASSFFCSSCARSTDKISAASFCCKGLNVPLRCQSCKRLRRATSETLPFSGHAAAAGPASSSLICKAAFNSLLKEALAGPALSPTAASLLRISATYSRTNTSRRAGENKLFSNVRRTAGGSSKAGAAGNAR